ncbi:hypothetical protein ASD25_21240 [Brevundimonas sp. Root1423]|nr:hypothetical protein ASD25_21240 [Brevundimonas sp. Root1423]
MAPRKPISPSSVMMARSKVSSRKASTTRGSSFWPLPTPSRTTPTPPRRTDVGDGLDLARDQAIGDVADRGAAVLFRQHGAEEAHLAQFGHDGAVEGLVAEGLDHAGQQLLAGVGPGRVLDHPLVVGQPARQVQRVVPAEGLVGSGGAVGHGGLS